MELTNLKCKCKVCLGYLAHCMIQPLRCPGLSCKDGRYYVSKKGGVIKWWDEIVEENRLECEKARDDYFKSNSQHLIEKGFEEPNEKQTNA